MSDFNKADVIKLATDTTENFKEYVGGDYSSVDYECWHCGANLDNASKVKHDQSCPVLVAQDLLTRCSPPKKKL